MSLPNNHNNVIEAEIHVCDPATMIVTARYIAPQCRSSPLGFVQGGFVAGFLDHVMGVVHYRASDEQASGPNVDLDMALLGAAHIGPFKGKGWVVKTGKCIVSLAEELDDTDGQLLATATSTAIPTPVPGKS